MLSFFGQVILAHRVTIYIIQMSKDQGLQNWHLFEQKEASELITVLKGIIADQENKIFLLEQDLRKWEKRYKQEFYKPQQKDQKSTIESSFATFSKELVTIQNKYQQSSHLKSQFQLGEVLVLIQRLYKDLAKHEKDESTKSSMIEVQTKTIAELNYRLQSFRTQFQIAVRKAESYEDKLLEEIRIQEEIIRKFKS